MDLNFKPEKGRVPSVINCYSKRGLRTSKSAFLLCNQEKRLIIYWTHLFYLQVSFKLLHNQNMYMLAKLLISQDVFFFNVSIDNLIANSRKCFYQCMGYLTSFAVKKKNTVIVSVELTLFGEVNLDVCYNKT